MKLLSTKKDKPRYQIIKLFKIVNISVATSFHMHKCINKCLDFMNESLSGYPDRYEMDYGQKSWNSKKAFDRAISKISNNNIIVLMSYYNSFHSGLIISNNILNYHIHPNKSSIEIQIAINSSSFALDSTTLFLRHLYDVYQYDYGYIVELTEDYDFGSERKIKQGLLETKVEIREIDNIWQFHMLGVKHGYIKNLYHFNIINSSHIEQQVIKSLLQEGVGKLSTINHEVSIWSLDSEEFNRANGVLKNSQYVIANSDITHLFLNSTDAKVFYEEMKIRE